MDMFLRGIKGHKNDSKQGIRLLTQSTCSVITPLTPPEGRMDSPITHCESPDAEKMANAPCLPARHEDQRRCRNQLPTVINFSHTLAY